MGSSDLIKIFRWEKEDGIMPFTAEQRQFHTYFHQGLRMQAYPLTQLRTLISNKDRWDLA